MDLVDDCPIHGINVTDTLEGDMTTTTDLVQRMAAREQQLIEEHDKFVRGESTDYGRLNSLRRKVRADRQGLCIRAIHAAQDLAMDCMCAPVGDNPAPWVELHDALRDALALANSTITVETPLPAKVLGGRRMDSTTNATKGE